MSLNNSKLDQLVSSDSEEGCHPNIEIKTWRRLRRAQKDERKRIEKERLKYLKEKKDLNEEEVNELNILIKKESIEFKEVASTSSNGNKKSFNNIMKYHDEPNETFHNEYYDESHDSKEKLECNEKYHDECAKENNHDECANENNHDGCERDYKNFEEDKNVLDFHYKLYSRLTKETSTKIYLKLISEGLKKEELDNYIYNIYHEVLTRNCEKEIFKFAELATCAQMTNEGMHILDNYDRALASSEQERIRFINNIKEYVKECKEALKKQKSEIH